MPCLESGLGFGACSPLPFHRPAPHGGVFHVVQASLHQGRRRVVQPFHAARLPAVTLMGTSSPVNAILTAFHAAPYFEFLFPSKVHQDPVGDQETPDSWLSWHCHQRATCPPGASLPLLLLGAGEAYCWAGVAISDRPCNQGTGRQAVACVCSSAVGGKCTISLRCFSGHRQSSAC